MERYTYFDSGKFRLKIDDTEYSGDWVDRLAAYEETGLEPEDMKKAFNEDATLKLAGQILGVTPGRLRELAQAKKEGRLVVLPCDVGDISPRGWATLMLLSNADTRPLYRESFWILKR